MKLAIDWIRARTASRLDLLIPFLVLIFFAMTTCITAVALLTSRTNANSEETALAIVKGALDREMGQLRDGMVGTARWDDAVAHLYGTLDAEWALTNLTYPNDSFLVSERGKTLWATTSMGKRLDRQLDRMIPADLPGLLARLPKTQKDAEARKTGEVMLARYQGGPAIVAAMALAPLHRPRTIPDDDLLYIVFVQPLDAHVLAKWQQAFQMQNIKWDSTAATDAGQHLPVRDSTGRLLGHISWQAPDAGHKALLDVLPLILLAVAGFVSASIWLFAIIRRSRQRIDASMRDAQTALDAAIASAAEAERAKQQAQTARNEALSSAQRQMDERHRHAADLREANRRVAAELKASLAGMVSETLASAAALEASATATLAMVSDQLGQAAAIRDRSKDASQAVGEISGILGKLALSVGELKKASSATESIAHEAQERAQSARRVNDNLLHNVDLVGRSAALIARISTQTNLLALNATIEAARSGEAGAGFAVVATEVKDLARLTHETTQAIQARMSGISSAASETVSNMEAVGLLVSKLLGSAVDAVATVHEQRTAVDSIALGSRHVVDNALASDDAIAAISASLDEIARVAADTRQIGKRVREGAERLNGGFLTLMEQLEAA